MWMALEQVVRYFPSVQQIIQSTTYDFATDLRTSIRYLFSPENLVTLRAEVHTQTCTPLLFSSIQNTLTIFLAKSATGHGSVSSSAHIQS